MALLSWNYENSIRLITTVDKDTLLCATCRRYIIPIVQKRTVCKQILRKVFVVNGTKCNIPYNFKGFFLIHQVETLQVVQSSGTVHEECFLSHNCFSPRSNQLNVFVLFLMQIYK